MQVLTAAATPRPDRTAPVLTSLARPDGAGSWSKPRPRNRHRAVFLVVVGALVVLQAATRPLDMSVQLMVVALAAIAGLPHGALDHHAAAPLLRPRFGALWPIPFLAGYLGLAALVLLGWAVAPWATLAGFLAASAVHFGLGDAEAVGRLRWAAVMAHGGAPIVVPALAHGEEMARIFSWLAGDGGLTVLQGLRGPAGLLWFVACCVALVAACRDPRLRPPLTELAFVIAAFVFLPPLLAFALYFGGLHSVRALLGEAGPNGTATSAGVLAVLRRAVVPSLGALAAAALGYVWLRQSATTPVAVVQAVFFGLSALTAPHMALAVVFASVPQTPPPTLTERKPGTMTGER